MRPSVLALALVCTVCTTCDSDRLRKHADCGGACYSGAPETRGVGRCRDGVLWCGLDALVECVGEILPEPEVCDWVDSDCDGALLPSEVDGDSDGWLACSECEDSDALVHPGGSEVCNGVDDNCDGQTDEMQPIIYCYSGPPGTATVGACHPGATTCRGGLWTICEHEVIPDVETCDNQDNDCDGVVDEGFSPAAVDVFERASSPAVDVLFVIDNSGSMMEEQAMLAGGFVAFLAAITGWDFHVAVTTTGVGGAVGCAGGADGGEAGRLFPVDGSRPRIITPATAGAAAVFASNVRVGLCHWWEQGLEGAYLALTPPLVDSADDPTTPAVNDGNLGFLRSEARLSVIYVSDEDDYSTRTVQVYADQLRALKPGRPDRLSAAAIVNTGSCAVSSSAGRRYMDLVQDLGGVVADICAPDWGAVLANIAAAATGGVEYLPLSAVPLAGTVRVELDGAELDGALWDYDAITNSVILLTAGGLRVAVSYRVDGCAP